jgi:hypothetical protein
LMVISAGLGGTSRRDPQSPRFGKRVVHRQDRSPRVSEQIGGLLFFMDRQKSSAPVIVFFRLAIDLFSVFRES